MMGSTLPFAAMSAFSPAYSSSDMGGNNLASHPVGALYSHNQRHALSLEHAVYFVFRVGLID